MKDDDKDKIEKKLEALMQASSAIAQQAYAQQSGEAAESAGAEGAAEASGKDRGDVLDAEFEEVKDKDQDRKASLIGLGLIELTWLNATTTRSSTSPRGRRRPISRRPTDASR